MMLQILASDNNSVTLTWVPPIGSASSTIDHVCSQCLEDYSVVQYANMSIAPVDIGFGFFGPNQAVGKNIQEIPLDRAYSKCVINCFDKQVILDHNMLIAPI